MDTELKRKWVEALRSGQFVQGHGNLRTIVQDGPMSDEFCCLGVLCEIAGLPSSREEVDKNFFDVSYVFPMDEEAAESHLVKLPHSHMDDAEIPSWYAHRTLGIGKNEGEAATLIGTLINMNDDQAASFNEIADWIEEYL